MARLGRSQPFKPLIQRPLAMRLRAVVLSEVVTLVGTMARTLSRSLSEIMYFKEGWGKCLSFDGVDDYVLGPNGVYLSNSACSFEFWYQAISVTNNEKILDTVTSGVQDGITVTQLTSGALQVVFRSGSTSTANLQTAALTTGVAYHICVTFNGTTSILYVNGSSVASDASTSFGAQSVPITLGRRSQFSSTYGNFYLDEFRTYTICLTPTQVSQHAIGQFADETGLQIYWDFDGISGTTIPDKSRNGNNGTILPDAGTGPQVATSIISQSLTYASGLSISRITYAILSEVITLVDSIVKNASKVFSEITALSDSMATQAVLFRSFSESIALVDSMIKTPVKVFDEYITLVDSVYKDISRSFLEIIALSDSFARDFVRSLSENLSIFDLFSKNPSKVFGESISLLARWRIGLNGVTVGIWSKISRIVSSWNGMIRKTSAWNATARKESTWRKIDRP